MPSSTAALNLLPFDSPRDLPPVQLGEVAIPVYGSLTVNEAIALEDLQSAGDLKALTILSLSQSGADLVTQAILATVLLVSRCSTQWTLEQVLALPPEQIQAACNLFLQERESGVSAQQAIAPQDYQSFRRTSFDWGYLFWRLQWLYPHDRRFNALNFGSCPIAIIEQALSAANHLQQQQASIGATPIAQLGLITAHSNGYKDPKLEWFNPYQAALSERAAKLLINPEAARSFLELSAQGEVPAWVIEIIDLDLLRHAAKEDN